jgi:hypothetical protein
VSCAPSRAPFRLSGAVPRDPAVEAWLDAQAGELGAIARTWFQALRGCGSALREVMHDGAPTVCLGDVAFAYVTAFTAHVDVGFFHGAVLPDPNGLLEGKGKYMRHVKLRPGATLDARAVEALIAAAYLDIVARVKAVE